MDWFSRVRLYDMPRVIFYSFSYDVDTEKNKETFTHGMSYKCALLKQSIIRALWEIGHNSFLKNQNWVRPMALERILGGLLRD